ncbi:MAG: ribonuclease HII [Actinobacteria bacterium RBG_19FT_COMBO_54_7]|uniref:Ribonuclease HII n=1 Tax=Candidatus Solincola sediminis TaxID=1797199 RepID=A0A1F2WFS9_9ACTN|nr:MAG: ribonuclease HII [Candidatus Solincola sediminis]OFW59987.1 MAG: ribonuclease HII [Candidatus Solincola sediminis]OFW69514.1 MAG: ribonuclease HII [Actinobacteria bacterium RBG_19FT_COMBO_54_7]
MAVGDLLLEPEKWGWRMGYARVAGTDEAGRGALAGPLVAAAVILPEERELAGLEGLTDSKLLAPEKRRQFFRTIIEVAESWNYACVAPGTIDSGGLQPANLSAMREAVAGLKPEPDLVIVDFYKVDDLEIPQWGLVHGDRVCRSVAAASVLAKVIRDHLMMVWAVLYPEYGFEKNKGYGTEQHWKALDELGPLPCHRASFKGVNQMELQLDEEYGA